MAGKMVPIFGAVLGALLVSVAAAQDGPWPADVKGFVPVQPGEHPRLLFRKADLPALKQKMNSPEGQAILKRLRVTLNGGDGESVPAKLGMKGRPGADGSGPLANEPVGSIVTFSHVAGYGLLYQLTGNKKYADMGRQCMDAALDGHRDKDQRYSFRQPYGALRAGPSIGWYALGYDLCYDGWEPDYRAKVAGEFANYNEGQWCSIEELTAGKRQHPGSNHWGMQVGGAAMTLLAVMNDPGADAAKIAGLLQTSQKSMIRNMTEGFGDGGFFAEGDGTGSMSSHIVFLPALQAWRTAAGKDFVTPRPNAQWMAFRWQFLSVGNPKTKPSSWFWPQRGGYPHNIWARDGISGGGYFSINMGIANEDQKAALLWYYNRFMKPIDEKGGTFYDAASEYPHHAVLSFVNWPVGMKEKDPDEVFPHAFRDTKYGFYAWRNRWQDENDVVISILTKVARGNMGAKAESTLSINAGGKHSTWGTIKGFAGEFAPAKDGSTVMMTGDGSCLAVDLSGASGADVMLIMTGPGAPAKEAIDAGGTKFSILQIGGRPATPEPQGNKVIVGGQTVSFDGRKIVLGK